MYRTITIDRLFILITLTVKRLGGGYYEWSMLKYNAKSQWI